MSLEKACSDPKFSMSRAGIEHVPLGPEASALTTELPVGPQGFWGSGENGYLFSGSWVALVIILGKLGSKLIISGI